MPIEQQQLTNTLSVLGNLDFTVSETSLCFPDGRILRVPTALLLAPVDSPSAPEQADGIIIPLIEEQLQVGKRVVETGKVQLHKAIETYDVALDEPLMVSTWQVERVPKREVVKQAPVIREEGDATVYPIIEERLIVTKELVLIEEVRVTRTVSERRDTQVVTLRRETLNVERKTVDTA